MATYTGAGFADVADRERLLALPRTGPAILAFEAFVARFDDAYGVFHAIRYTPEGESVQGMLDGLLLTDEEAADPDAFAGSYPEEADPHEAPEDTVHRANVAHLDRFLAELREAFRLDTAVSYVEDGERKTSHLTITPAHHDGDGADEVDGLYYDIGNLSRPTPAAEGFAEALGIGRRFYTFAC
jgi:hypothetical protein